MIVKLSKPWSGKKPETNPALKEAHKERKAKKIMLQELQQKDWKEQVKDYESK